MNEHPSMQQRIIRELDVKPEIDPSHEIEQRTTFLAQYLAQSGLRGFTLGISGGQDSLLAGVLAQRAVEMNRADGNDTTFHAMLLPYGSQADRDDALAACEFIQPDVMHDFNIQPGVDAFAETFEATEGHSLKDFDKGNVKARMRMIAQYALAGDQNLLVIGTDHAAEAVTGFYTKYGDGGADILPLSGLTKRQGKALLRELGAPEHLITKPPTADLLDATPGQADETELGIKYDLLDDYLEGKPVSEEVAQSIEARYLNTAHKRSLPVGY
ncbi:ammonia-dependent NAD(+) synthetase [Candidatus Saccharibacteria bacterium TM7i]|nr:ammonia-dependent NAD(+) synthetase [Candidatus Saccharibacteria bacterium TM7i]